MISSLFTACTGPGARCSRARLAHAPQRRHVAIAAMLAAVATLAAPGLLAQYSTTKFIDPNTFPTDTNSGFTFGQPAIATDGTYTAISTNDAVWSKTVDGGTPLKLFSVGTNLPGSTTPATGIYGAVEVSDGTVVFNATGSGIYGIYSVPADGSGSAVRVADSTQVQNTTLWSENEGNYGTYGLFAVARGTVVFSVGQALFSAGTDGSNLTTLWMSTAQNQGCSTAGQDANLFLVDGVFNPATDGTNMAYTGSSTLDFVALYTEPLGTIDGCNDVITSGLCNICGPVSTLPGQPQPGIAFTFTGILQIDSGYVYFSADAGGGVSSSEDYYGIFRVPLTGGAATAIVTNLSQLPLLKNSSGGYDEPYFSGYAVNNGRVIFYAGDNSSGGAGEPAFYMVQNGAYVPVFTSQTSVANQCTGNMTGSNSAGLVQPMLTADGHLYFPGEYVTTGPDLNGSCTYSFLRFQPFAYYVVDTTHPLIQAQTTISTTPAPADITATTPVTLNVAVGPTSGAANPGGLIPTGTVTVWYTSPQIYGVQQPATATLDNTGHATISLGEFDAAQRTFTVAYGGDTNFTQSGSNAITFDTRAKPTLTWATPAPMPYGTALSSTQLDAVATANGGTLAGTYVYTPAAGTVLPVGSNTLSVAFTANDTGDYQPVTTTVQVMVTPESTILSPTPGSTLSGANVTFTWSAGSGVSEYFLSLGTTGVGSKNLYNPGATTALSANVTGLPTNGSLIYARLGSKISGTWQTADFTFYAAAVPAALTSPTPGSTLAGANVTFMWTAGSGVTEYFLTLGSKGAGSNNLFNPGATTALSASATGLPTNGETIYARLGSKIDGAWQETDYTYTASSTPAALTSPAPGSGLTGSSVTFTWTAGSGATEYFLTLGSAGVGSNNLYNPGATTALSASVTGLPTNGETIYARLGSKINGVWQSTDYTYKADGVPAALTSPAPGSTLSGANVTFSWTAGTAVTGYFLTLGSTGVGSNNLYNPGATTATTASVTALPTNGETIYARLGSKINGVWQSVDYTYKAQ